MGQLAEGTQQELKEEARARTSELKKASKDQLEVMAEARNQNFYFFAVLASIAAFLGLEERRRYQRERTFFEQRLGKLDEQTERHHSQHVAPMLSAQHENLEQINRITTAIADGTTKNVESLQATLEAFQKILDFKVQEVQESRKAVEEMQLWRVEIERQNQSQRRSLMREAIELRRPRHVYIQPDPGLRRRMNEYAVRFDLVQPQLSSDDADHDQLGEMYLRRGIVAYYDNDPVKARDSLRQVQLTISAPDATLSADAKKTIAFAEFYLALVQKNYGDLREAERCINHAFKLHGEGDQSELLTPTTRAEILSYGTNIEQARVALQDIVGRNLDSAQRHDQLCISRARLMLGHTYYREQDWDAALKQYETALSLGSEAEYYVQCSIAQTLEHKGLPSEAAASWGAAYKALEESRHLETKTALDTQISLHALGIYCNRTSDRRRAQVHFDRVKELLARVDGSGDLQLRLFSFEKKKLVEKDAFWAELAQILSGAPAPQERGT